MKLSVVGVLLLYLYIEACEVLLLFTICRHPLVTFFTRFRLAVLRASGWHLTRADLAVHIEQVVLVIGRRVHDGGEQIVGIVIGRPNVL